MATFEGAFHETFITGASARHARDVFADLDQITTHYGELERAEKLDDRTLAFYLPPKNHGITLFTGRYDCRYEPYEDHTLIWTTVGDTGNIRSEGRAVFTTGSDGRTTIDYQARLQLEMEVGRIAARLLGPVIRQAMNRETRAYVKRMIRAAETPPRSE
jgi:hypothetical protein